MAEFVEETSPRLARELPTPFYGTALGAAYLGDAAHLTHLLEPGSIDLILTSPPFALTRQKEYGNIAESDYVDWFMSFAIAFKRVLKPSGSFVLDLGGAYLRGSPVRTIYQFDLLVRLCRELGFYLAQEFFHFNPSRLPAPAEWVTVRRVRVKDSVNVVWWLSATRFPKADNRRVLQPYSDSMETLLRNGYRPKMRPSGHDISSKFARRNEGAIPPNLLTLANTESNSLYLRRCRDAGIRPHPARFPAAFPEFFIRFLTDPGDLVLDPFAGSNTTGFAAEGLERRWLAFELREDYVRGSMLRFYDPREPSLFPLVTAGAAAK
jgi:site-specific DNA-methyltransferase (cytosine-N4-specific)